LDRETEQHLEQILTLARQSFSAVEIIKYDISEERALLKLKCTCEHRDVFVTGVITQRERWYSYYLLESKAILIGLDNYPDRPALRLKYGDTFGQHLHEPIPHIHTENKQKLELTEEQTFADFMQMVSDFCR